MERERRRRRDASSPPPPPSVGFRSWLLLLLFSLLLLLFFPSFLSSSSRGFRPFAVRNGWDALNLLLVLFAILCGVLSRRSGGSGDDADRFPRQSAPDEWLGFSHHRVQVSYSHHPVEASPGDGILRQRSGSSYPLLRPDGATLDAGGSGALRDWHRYDATPLYRQRVEARVWEGERAADFGSKMIAVDSYVLRRSPSPRSRSPQSPPPPLPQPQSPPTTRAVAELPVREVEKNEIFLPQTTHSPTLSSPPPRPVHPSQRQPRRRRRKVEKVPESREVDRDEIFGSENPHQRSPSRPPLTQRQRRRRSMEKLPEGEVGLSAAPKAEDTPLQASATSGYLRRRSVGDIPKREVDQDPSFGLVTPPASPPSTLLAPPSPQPQAEEEEEKKSHKKRNNVGAKDIAAAIALFYPKKKGSKAKRSSDDTALRGEDPASSAPPPPVPPPPPPQSSVFHLFSQKKGGSKNRRIHSDSASAQPPPPPLPSILTQQSREQVLHSSPQAPSPPPPAPPPQNWHDKGKEKVYPDESPSLPVPPSSSLPPRLEKSNLPFPFPPHPPPYVHQPILEDEMAAANRSGRAPEKEAVAMMKFKERESKERVAVSCPSPDVDNKADLFIARCHANWKLEKQNSMREKEQRKQRKESKRA